jgi:hypothetical protein
MTLLKRARAVRFARRTTPSRRPRAFGRSAVRELRRARAWWSRVRRRNAKATTPRAIRPPSPTHFSSRLQLSPKKKPRRLIAVAHRRAPAAL